jgi:hypothetical protein
MCLGLPRTSVLDFCPDSENLSGPRASHFPLAPSISAQESFLRSAKAHHDGKDLGETLLAAAAASSSSSSSEAGSNAASSTRKAGEACTGHAKADNPEATAYEN